MYRLMVMDKVWVFITAIRLLWTCVGQTGYIHPDEFFQTTEVVAGDLLNITIEKTWEFRGDQPLRSIFLPMLTCGLPLLLWKQAAVTGLVSMTSHVLLVLPRFVFTLLSILTDFMVYHTARKIKVSQNASLCRLVFATSYVSSVYFTRTLSNSLEAFLFAALLHNVFSRTPEKAKVNHSNAVVLTVITVLGIWNRPTFLCFALVPGLYWLGKQSYKTITASMITVSLTGLLTALWLIICDSLYYGTLDEIYQKYMSGDFDHTLVLLSSLTITPINFIKYNTDPHNVAQHGIHFRGQHFLVNTFLLFNIMAIFPTFTVINYAGKTITGRLFSTRKDCGLILLLIYLTPIALLSLIPHQEPRFLLPLLAPLCLLYHTVTYRYRIVWYIWLTGNVLCAAFYGCLHQGGVIASLSYLGHHIKSNHIGQHVHIIYHNTYMPPRQFLMMDPTVKTELHDLKGADFAELDNTLKKFKDKTVFYISPSTTVSQHCQVKSIQLDLIHNIFPHFSTENLPSMDTLSCDSQITAITCDRHCSQFSLIERVKAVFSLNIYAVKYLTS